MGKITNDKNLITKYIVICFGITYLAWGIVAYYSMTQQINFNEYTWMLALYVLGVISPAISAIYVERKVGKKNWKEIHSNIFKCPNHINDWIIAIFVVAIIQFIPYFIWGGEKIGSFINLLVLIPMFIVIGGLEEVGWRGFWLERELVSKKKSKIMSVLIIGIVWEVWHLPLFFMLGTYQQVHTNIVAHLISTLGIAFVLGALYLRSRSTLLCMIVHSLINSFSDILIVRSNWVEKVLTFGFCIIIFFVISVIENKKLRA